MLHIYLPSCEMRFVRGLDVRDDKLDHNFTSERATSSSVLNYSSFISRLLPTTTTAIYLMQNVSPHAYYTGASSCSATYSAHPMLSPFSIAIATT
jgi:hypothetical protein